MPGQSTSAQEMSGIFRSLKTQAVDPARCPERKASSIRRQINVASREMVNAIICGDSGCWAKLIPAARTRRTRSDPGQPWELRDG